MIQKLAIASIAFGLSFAHAEPTKVTMEEILFSNQLESATRPYRAGVDNPETFPQSGFFDILQRNTFLKYQDVINKLHPDVEKETDVVYLVNTSEKANTCESFNFLSVPKQHMIVLKRTSPDTPMFDRDASGLITGINSQGSQILTLAREGKQIQYGTEPRFKSLQNVSMSSETTYVPVSTGIPSGQKILTYSGIFRVNERRTNEKRKSTNTVSDPMQYSVYINGQYNDGGEARLALHGTSKKYWGLLGESRASSGCIRLQSDFSQWNQAFLFEKASDGQLVPKPEFTGNVKVWNPRDHFPPAQEQFESLATGKKLKVLIIFFDGYSNTCS